MNEAQVPITPSLGADFRTQVLTLVEQLVLAAEENEPLALADGRSAATQGFQHSHIRTQTFFMVTWRMKNRAVRPLKSPKTTENVEKLL